MNYTITQEQFEEIRLFMARVNKVTSYFRHGGKIPESSLITLSNHQIDIDTMLDKIEINP